MRQTNSDFRNEPANEAVSTVSQPSLFISHNQAANSDDLDKLTTEAIRSGFRAEVIGDHVLRLAASGSIEQAVAYVAIIAKAKLPRAARVPAK